MASEFTPEQIAEAQAKYDEAVRSGAANIQDFADNLRDAKVGVKNYSKQLRENSQLFKSSAKRFGQGLLDGKKGMSQYNDVIGVASDGLSTLAKGIPVIGTAVSGLIKAVGWYAKKVTEQADALGKTYQEIAKVGVTGAQGVQGVFDSMQKFGYTMGEIGDFSALMQENSETLAKLGGTALEGSEIFGNMASSLTRSEFGTHLQEMGMTIDDLNKGGAAYLKLKTQQGQAQNMSQQQLLAGAAEYIEQQDKLAKITGINSKEQADIRQQAAEDPRFGAATRAMRARGEEKRAQMLEDLNVVLAKDAPEIAKGMRDIAAGGGAVNTPEAIKLANSAKETAKMIASGKYTKEQIFDSLQKELKESANVRDRFAAAGAGSDALVDAYQASLVVGRKSLEESNEAAKKEQNVTDSATKNIVGFENANRNTTQALDKGFNKGLAATTWSLSKISGGVSAVATTPGAIAPGTLAPGGTGAQIGGGGAKDPNAGNPEASGGATKGYSQQDLASQGLKMKQGDVQAPGAPLDERLIGLAKKIQGMSNFGVITGLNDAYHLKNRPKSLHAQGRGMDFTTNPAPKNAAEAAQTKQEVKAMGAPVVLDEYFADRGSYTTGGHFHVQFDKGGVASGPKSGYAATLHGTEAVVPLPDGKSIPVQMTGSEGDDEQNGMLEAQIEKMSELYSIMQNQLALTTKILQRTT